MNGNIEQEVLTKIDEFKKYCGEKAYRITTEYYAELVVDFLRCNEVELAKKYVSYFDCAKRIKEEKKIWV